MRRKIRVQDGEQLKVKHGSNLVKMYSPAACASCAMSTAGKSNHSATRTTHPLVGNVRSFDVWLCVEVKVVLWQNG